MEKTEKINDIQREKLLSKNPKLLFKDQKEFEVMIPLQKNDPEKSVKLGCQGYFITIPKGKWKKIPESFKKILDNAMRKEFYYEENIDGSNTLKSRMAMRYPYQVKA